MNAFLKDKQKQPQKTSSTSTIQLSQTAISSSSPQRDSRPHFCLMCAKRGRKLSDGPCICKKDGAGKPGGGDDSSQQSVTTEEDLDEKKNAPNTQDLKPIETESFFYLGTVKEESLRFDSYEIADLLLKKCISIENHENIGVLKISFLSNFLTDPKKLEEVLKFIQAIKDELKLCGIPENKYNIREETIGNMKSIIFNLSPDLYEKWINKVNKDIFSLIQHAIENAHSYTSTEKLFHPTPFSTRYLPRGPKASS